MEAHNVPLERIKELQAATIIDVSHPVRGTQPLAILNVSNVSDEGRIKHVQANIKRDVMRFCDLPRHVARNEPLALIAGGPSVRKHLKEIKKYNQIWACGSVHDYLVEQGITPSFASACDALPDQLDHFRKPQKKTSYFIASQCDPRLFDMLEGHKIALWHFDGQIPKEHYQGEEAVGWGCMITIISMTLALQMGFQEIHIYGMDCCLDENTTHAYNVPESEYMRSVSGEVFVGMLQKRFVTTMSLMLQCDEFFRLLKSEFGRYLKCYIHGGGMLAEVIKQSPPEMKRWVEAA